MKKRQCTNLAGRRYGKLVVLRDAPRGVNPNGKIYRVLVCRCDCDETKEVNVRYAMLTSGHTKSCGCLKLIGYTTTHSKSRTAIYAAWTAMKTRCYNGKYKEKGIEICERWMGSFEAFYEDMGDRPSPKHSVDRIDNTGNYEPGNCRWATATEQVRNRSITKRYEYQGKSLTAAEWSTEIGIGYDMFRARLLRGWSIEQAINQPYGVQRKRV